MCCFRSPSTTTTAGLSLHLLGTSFPFDPFPRPNRKGSGSQLTSIRKGREGRLPPFPTRVGWERREQRTETHTVEGFDSPSNGNEGIVGVDRWVCPAPPKGREEEGTRWKRFETHTKGRDEDVLKSNERKGRTSTDRTRSEGDAWCDAGKTSEQEEPTPCLRRWEWRRAASGPRAPCAPAKDCNAPVEGSSQPVRGQGIASSFSSPSSLPGS